MPRRETRRARLAIAWGALVLGAALIVAQVAGVTGRDTELDYEWTSAGLLLSNDGAGSAIFNASGLAPGDSRTNCVAVTYDDTESAVLRLYGAATGAGATAVDLTVDIGTGGSYGDCSTFSGAPAYTGTLAGFALSHSDFATGVVVPDVASGTPVSFRFTATVRDDNTAQGQTADVTFTWEAQSIPAPPAPTTTTTAPPATTTTTAPPAPTTTTTVPVTVPTVPTTVPTVPTTVPVATTLPEVPVDTTVPAVPDIADTVDDVVDEVADQTGRSRTAPVRRPTSPEADESTTASSSTTSTSTTVGPPPASPTDGGLQPTDSPAGPPAEAEATGLAAVFELLAKVAVVAAKESSFPGSLLLVIALFLIAQDRIDRKDPKLALAPTHRESALGFSDDGGEQ